MDEETLTVIRNEILDALRESITQFAAEAEPDLNSLRCHDATIASRLNWVVGKGQEALENLTIFFNGSNVKVYSGQTVAKYVWISCIYQEADSGKYLCCICSEWD